MKDLEKKEKNIKRLDSENMREKIKNKLNVKKWSVRCQRLKEFIKETKTNVENVIIVRTGDFRYMQRKNRDEKYHWRNIGCDGDGKRWKFYIFAIVEKKN